MEFETFFEGDARLELPPKQIRGSFRSTPVSRREAWFQVLQSLGGFDFHHTPDFHRLESDRDPGGQAELMIYAELPHTIAVPLIVRSMDVSDPDSSDIISLFDARALYGCGTARHDNSYALDR